MPRVRSHASTPSTNGGSSTSGGSRGTGGRVNLQQAIAAVVDRKQPPGLGIAGQTGDIGKSERTHIGHRAGGEADLDEAIKGRVQSEDETCGRVTGE